MNLSNETEKYLEYFIGEYDSFKKKETKEQKNQVEAIYKQIYKEFTTSEKELKHIKKSLTQQLVFLNYEQEIIPKTNLLTSKFVPKEMKNYIDNEALFYIKNSIKIRKRDVKIYFVFYDEGDLNNLDKYNAKLHYMLLWLNIATKVSSIRCSKTLNIYIYLTPFKKEIPISHFEVIGPRHSNSGLTTTCSVYNEICIYRKEEFLKIFIHETFHSLGLDFSAINESQYLPKVKKIFPLNIKFNLYEAYSEFWASIFNNALLAYSTLEKNKIKKDKFKHFKNFLHLSNNLERIFSLYQINKLLYFFNIDYQNFYEDDKLSNYVRQYIYKEKTNVFSYYIVKGILMYNYIDFLIWCNQTNLIFFKFDKHQGNIRSFINFIKSTYKNREFLEDLKKMNLLNLQTKHPSVEYIDKTLRMTVMEF